MVWLAVEMILPAVERILLAVKVISPAAAAHAPRLTASEVCRRRGPERGMIPPAKANA
jgi:hypothetical protein